GAAESECCLATSTHQARTATASSPTAAASRNCCVLSVVFMRLLSVVMRRSSPPEMGMVSKNEKQKERARLPAPSLRLQVVLRPLRTGVGRLLDHRDRAGGAWLVAPPGGRVLR